MIGFGHPTTSRYARGDDWTQASAAFILSTGRVGSVSLIDLLNLSPSISAHHEPEPRLTRWVRRSFERVDREPSRFARLFARSRADMISLALKQHRCYVEATWLKFFAPVIAQQMPRARFIHIHRHPGGVIRSAMRRGWYDGHAYDYARPVPAPTDPARGSWRKWTAFQRNCWMWTATNQRFCEFGDSLGPRRYCRLSFESLFGGTTEAIDHLFNFIGVEPPDPSDTLNLTQVPSNAQTAGEFPRYEQWTYAMRSALDQIAGPMMHRLGYERPNHPEKPGQAHLPNVSTPAA